MCRDPKNKANQVPAKKPRPCRAVQDRADADLRLAVQSWADIAVWLTQRGDRRRFRGRLRPRGSEMLVRSSGPPTTRAVPPLARPPLSSPASPASAPRAASPAERQMEKLKRRDRK
ncbi:hypothetical protein CapIbe_023205 [Capra ibex]